MLLAQVAMSLAACGTSVSKPLPPPVPTLDVHMTDYRYQHQPAALAGRLVFRIANAGSVEHTLTLLRMPDDFTKPPQALFVDSTVRTFGVTANLFPHKPGTTGTFAVDLQPGRYALVCFLTDSDGRKHFEHGMVSELTVS